MKRLWILSLLLFLTSACSTQYREADPQVSSDELFRIIAGIQNEVSDPVVRALNVDSLSDGNSSILFHAQDGVGRPAPSVLSMIDMGVFDKSVIGIPSINLGLTKVDAVFIDTVNEFGERSFSLLLKWQEFDPNQKPELRSYAFAGSSLPGSALFSDSEFQVDMLGASGQTLIIRSNDLSEKYQEELASSIKLKIYVLENGVEYYAGQISTMAGFGNR